MDKLFEEKLKLFAIKEDREFKDNNKNIDDEFKQEVCNRLIIDEKKFVDINENILILDKNINILCKKIDSIETSLASGAMVNNNQAQCYPYNSCEVHSHRTNFVLKGKEEEKTTYRTEENEKTTMTSEKENNLYATVKSMQNDINTKVNTNYERTSEKFQLNNAYLQCDPVEFLEYSKTTMRNYLPKYYLADKKSFVNIIEACFEMGQEDFEEELEQEHANIGAHQKHTNQDLVPLQEDGSFLLHDSEDFDDFLKESGSH